MPYKIILVPNNQFFNLTMNKWKIEIKFCLINYLNKNPFKICNEKL